jgi:hypothetical protein
LTCTIYMSECVCTLCILVFCMEEDLNLTTTFSFHLLHFMITLQKAGEGWHSSNTYSKAVNRHVISRPTAYRLLYSFPLQHFSLRCIQRLSTSVLLFCVDIQRCVVLIRDKDETCLLYLMLNWHLVAKITNIGNHTDFVVKALIKNYNIFAQIYKWKKIVCILYNTCCSDLLWCYAF